NAKIIKKFPFGTICTPKNFLIHLKTRMLKNTAGAKKGELAKETILKDLS
ncbi:NADH-dependent butanol dehydrogenase a, partial [Capnocytophaga sp. oral taxon 338 str. F0234]